MTTMQDAAAGPVRTAETPESGVNVHPDGDRAASIPQHRQAPTREVLRARYLAVATTPREFARSDGGADIGADNSRDWYRLEKVLRRWAATTAGGDVREVEMESLEQLVGKIAGEIERQILDWAEGIGR